MLGKSHNLRPLFILVLAILSLFLPLLWQPTHILFPTFSPFSDLMVIHWPKAHLMAHTWQTGDGLPYWTPLISSGMPLAANQLAMLFYPPAWLFLFLPLALVFNVLLIFHFLLGGIGIYLYLREIHRVSPHAALLGALTFALNGKWLAHAAGGHVSMVGAVAWLPWVLFCVQKLWLTPDKQSRPRYTWASLAALALTMQLLTHTLIFIYSVYLIAAIILWQLYLQPNRLQHIKHNAGPLLTIPLLTGLLGAIQLWPLIELAQFSNRNLTISQATEFSLSPLQLFVGLFLPTAQAGHEHIIYLGLVSLLLALVGLFSQNKWRWFYALLILFAVLFALGPHTPIHGLFYHFAPGFRWVRTPARMFFVGSFGLAMLVAFGVDRLRQDDWSPTLIPWLTRFIFMIGSLTFLMGLGLLIGFAQFSRGVLGLLIVLPFSLGLVFLYLKRIVATPLAISILGFLLFLDLISFNATMMRFVWPEEALTPGREVAQYLAQQPGHFRVYSPSYSIPMQTAATAGLSLADGVEPVQLASYVTYMAQAGGYQDASFSVTIPKFDGPLDTALADIEPDLALLGLLNVEYLVSAFPMSWDGLALQREIEGTYIYRNERAWPRAWLTNALSPAGAERTKKPTIETLVEVTDPIPVQITHYSPNHIDLTVPPRKEPGAWLILSEIWYPGWQATVNDQPQPIEPIDGLLRGLYLAGSGSYQVTLEYRPPSIIWGSRISGVAALFIIGVFIWLKLYHKKQPVTPSE